MPYFFREIQISPVSRMLLALSTGIFLIYLAFLKPVIWGIDGNEVLQVAHSLITHHSFSVTSDVGGMAGVDGQNYSIRYLLLPIVITPFVAVGIGLSNWLGMPALQVSAIFAVASSVILTVATAVFVALLALRLGSRQKGAYLAALCYAFGTIALTYAQTLFSEPLLAFLTVACVYFAFGNSWREWIGCSVLAALAILAKPAGIVIGPVISLYFLAKRYSRLTILGPILVPTVGLLVYAFYNYTRFGNPFITGQPVSVGLTFTGMPERFFGFLFGSGMGGGLVWYCPPVVLAIVGARKTLQFKLLEILTILGIFLGFLLLHSIWFCCGWDWGPRFLVPVLPLLMALTGLLDYRGRQLLILLSVIGFVISAPTLISFYQRYYWELENAGYRPWQLSLWSNLTDAPIVNLWGAAYRQIGEATTTDVRAVLAGQNSMTVMQTIPVWWWMLPIANIPVWYGAIAAGGLITVGTTFLGFGWLTISDRPSNLENSQ